MQRTKHKNCKLETLRTQEATWVVSHSEGGRVGLMKRSWSKGKRDPSCPVSPNTAVSLCGRQCWNRPPQALASACFSLIKAQTRRAQAPPATSPTLLSVWTLAFSTGKFPAPLVVASDFALSLEMPDTSYPLNWAIWHHVKTPLPILPPENFHKLKLKKHKCKSIFPSAALRDCSSASGRRENHHTDWTTVVSDFRQ